MDNFISYPEATKQALFVINRKHSDKYEARLMKKLMQECYKTWGSLRSQNEFLNWGLWEKKLYNEYNKLAIADHNMHSFQDICPRLLLYYLIRPLVKKQYFNKRLLDVGCGNGLGLKAASELLKTTYSVGVDLTYLLATHARNNFYSHEKINILQSDAENLPIKNNSFDIITNLESSHTYPRIVDFFFEVERILSVGGYFCYADINIASRSQVKNLNTFLKEHKNLRIIQKTNITKLVQASIYKRLIADMENFYVKTHQTLGNDPEAYISGLSSFAISAGLFFLPWWQVRFENQELKWLGKLVRKHSFWIKKHYFYYLIQKIS